MISLILFPKLIELATTYFQLKMQTNPFCFKLFVEQFYQIITYPPEGSNGSKEEKTLTSKNIFVETIKTTIYFHV